LEISPKRFIGVLQSLDNSSRRKILLLQAMGRPQPGPHSSDTHSSGSPVTRGIGGSRVNVATDPETEFEQELRTFENDLDEVVQCLYIWQTVHSVARKSRRVYDLLNRNAGFWVLALGCIQANSLIALGPGWVSSVGLPSMNRQFRMPIDLPGSQVQCSPRRSGGLSNRESLFSPSTRLHRKQRPPV
jgi:hypothetical protein